MRKNIELITNIAIILTFFIFVGVLINKFYFAAPHAEKKEIKLGSQISLPNVAWEKGKKNLVMALQIGCRYCAESADFYKKLVPAAKEKNVQTIAVLPTEAPENQKYLDDLGIPGIENRQIEFDSLNVSGTPTLILVGEQGEVIKYWVGKLKPETEEEVLKSL